MTAIANMGNGRIYGSSFNFGDYAADSIKFNLNSFWLEALSSGYSRKQILELSKEQGKELDAKFLEEINAMADGAKVNYNELLAFNIFHSLLLPEECTVLMAVGNASATGNTIFLKNSDKVGGSSLVGPNFYRNKEINVLRIIDGEDGVRIVGISAAGSTGLKMGINNFGIAAGTNIARTQEMARRKIDLSQLRAVDRAQLIREGLEKKTALDALNLVVSRVTNIAMATPGNVEFADANNAYIIESSYSVLAVEKVFNDVECRANRFQILHELNQPDDVSSICRYTRAKKLLNSKKGKITIHDMIDFSCDHSNGPGPNSICRHGESIEEEVSLSAMVMEINSKEPNKSKISVALGKPCCAWNADDGHITIEMDTPLEEVPEGFLDGSVFKKFYTE